MPVKKKVEEEVVEYAKPKTRNGIDVDYQKQFDWFDENELALVHMGNYYLGEKSNLLPDEKMSVEQTSFVLTEYFRDLVLEAKAVILPENVDPYDYEIEFFINKNKEQLWVYKVKENIQEGKIGKIGEWTAPDGWKTLLNYNLTFKAMNRNKLDKEQKGNNLFSIIRPLLYSVDNW